MVINETEKDVSNFILYKVKLTSNALNVRKGPGVNHAVLKTLLNDKNEYAIVEESTDSENIKWGKLESDAGWISLAYVVKV